MTTLNDFDKLWDAVRDGSGMTYIHFSDVGGPQYVLMDMDRFQEEEGGFDPGHNDDFAHSHVVLKLTKNAATCAKCGKTIESTHRHDFVGCGCPAEIFVDGGLDYLRRGAKSLDDIIEASEYTVT